MRDKGSRAVKFIEVSPPNPSFTCAFVAGGSLQLLATSILEDPRVIRRLRPKLL
jgi:hypothetical protein